MTDNARPEPTDETLSGEPEVCPMSLDEHMSMAMTALTMFGLGMGCEKEYQALTVIAEIAKQVYGFAPFDPIEAAGPYVVEVRAEKEKRKAAEDAANLAAAMDVFVAAGNNTIN